jgi:hypothetical protein
MEMKHDAEEQGFQELRARIDQRFGQYFQGDLHRIENKRLLEVFVLKAPLVNREKDTEKFGK